MAHKLHADASGDHHERKRIEGRSDAARDLVTLAGVEVTHYTYQFRPPPNSG